jgi:hypothetical protein
MDFAKSIEKLIALSKTDCDTKDIESCVRVLIKDIYPPKFTFQPPFLCRGRINEIDKIFSSKADLIYPPAPKKISAQRSNYKGQQVFYAAVPSSHSRHGIGHCQNVACLEVIWEHVTDHSIMRQPLTLSRWIVKRPLVVCILAFAPESWELNEDFKNAAQNYKNAFLKRGNYNEDHLTVLRYFSEIFCKKDDKREFYKISAAYYNVLKTLMRNDNQPFDGLIYSSANTGAAGMNMVLEKALIDNGDIELDYVVMMEMQRSTEDAQQLAFIPTTKSVVPDKHGRFYF